MFSKITKKLNLIFSLLMLVSTPTLTLANEKDASNFINDLSYRVIEIVKSNNQPDQDKEIKLNNIFLESVDTKWIGRFAIGKFWRTITSPQQENFLNLYSKYLTGLYVPNFKKYTGNTVTVTSVKSLGTNEYIVSTHLVDSAKTMDIKIDYRLVHKNSNKEHFVIIDVVAEGVSLITTQRAELTSVMENNGFDSLIALLKQKISTQY